MAPSSEGITNVRIARFDVAGPDDGPPAALEVTWASTQTGRWHQVYVNGRFAGVTATPEDRRLLVPVPAEAGGAAERLFVEVLAVEGAERGTGFSADLVGPGAGSRVRLTWQAGPHLDPALAAFEVFGDGGTGVVDYETPLGDAPLEAEPEGRPPWGFGTGGFGVGGYGDGAAVYSWTSDGLAPGTWRFAVVAVDEAGNRAATAAEREVSLAPFPRPPADFVLAEYDPGTRTATLAWTPSPDVA